MVFYDMIPTAATPMSEYTRMTFYYVIVLGSVCIGGLIWWVKREFKRVDTRIDNAIKTTNAMETIINKMGTDIAVTLVKIDAIEKGVNETKDSIDKINDVLMSWKT